MLYITWVSISTEWSADRKLVNLFIIVSFLFHMKIPINITSCSLILYRKVTVTVQNNIQLWSGIYIHLSARISWACNDVLELFFIKGGVIVQRLFNDFKNWFWILLIHTRSKVNSHSHYYLVSKFHFSLTLLLSIKKSLA